MGRAKALTEPERSVILALFDENNSEREIAERISRSKTAVHNVVVASRTNETRLRPERPRLVTQTAMRGMIRRASAGMYSARELHGMFKSKVRRVQQLLSGVGHLVYKKMAPAPKINRRLFEAHVQWA